MYSKRQCLQEDVVGPCACALEQAWDLAGRWGLDIVHQKSSKQIMFASSCWKPDQKYCFLSMIWYIYIYVYTNKRMIWYAMICIYICIYICICIWIYIYMYICIYMYILCVWWGLLHTVLYELKILQYSVL